MILDWSYSRPANNVYQQVAPTEIYVKNNNKNNQPTNKQQQQLQTTTNKQQNTTKLNLFAVNSNK